MKDNELAKRMFIAGGFLFLPFLWMLNTLDNYERVFGPAPWPASLCCSSSDEHDDEDGSGRYSSHERSDSSADHPDSVAVNENDNLKKWVKRSAIGSFVSICVFIAWTLVFQLLSRQSDSIIGPNWFVMSEDEEELTGW